MLKEKKINVIIFLYDFFILISCKYISFSIESKINYRGFLSFINSIKLNIKQKVYLVLIIL